MNMNRRGRNWNFFYRKHLFYIPVVRSDESFDYLFSFTLYKWLISETTKMLENKFFTYLCYVHISLLRISIDEQSLLESF